VVVKIEARTDAGQNVFLRTLWWVALSRVEFVMLVALARRGSERVVPTG
jgi:hypothetical protein